jgi:serine/threonine protein kinase
LHLLSALRCIRPGLCRVFRNVRLDSEQARYTQISDRYEISHELGRGGMAVVYLARQTDLDRWVALKELHPEPRDASIVRRFLRESRLAGSLSHPNIVTVLDFFERDGVGYIAMEYVPRGSLRPYVGSLTLAQTAGVLEGILAALTCAEHGGIVHRDLKPENVMITWDGRVKLTDFGIAKATSAASMLTAAGTTLGTPHYMAPEQAMAQEVGAWTDLYSVGCMAYELFTGRLPFADTEAPTAILLRHVNDVPPPPNVVRTDLDAGVSDWICGLLEKDPTLRPPSAAAAWEALEEIVLTLEGPRWRRSSSLPQIDGGGEVPGPPPHRPRRRCRTSRCSRRSTRLRWPLAHPRRRRPARSRGRDRPRRRVRCRTSRRRPRRRGR